MADRIDELIASQHALVGVLGDLAGAIAMLAGADDPPEPGGTLDD